MNCAQHEFKQGFSHCLVCNEPAPWTTNSKNFIGVGIGGSAKRSNAAKKKAKREENLRKRAEENRKRRG